MQHNLLTYENVNVYLMLVFSILYYAMLWDIWKHIFILICHCCNFIEIVGIAPWLSESEINIQ